MNNMATLIAGHTQEYVDQVRLLFKEYAAWLGVDLCFQDFEQELAELPGAYAPPTGRILLALEGEQVVGCVALKMMDKSICEMKRLYVQPHVRKKGVGRQLAQAIIDIARGIGYTVMRLDTLAPMTDAVALYRSLGFVECEPYYHNPLDEVVYMELALG